MTAVSEVRTVEVPLRRLEPWLAGFRRRHPDVRVRAADDRQDGVLRWEAIAADGQRALVEVPRWLVGPAGESLDPDSVPRDGSPAAVALATPTFAVLIVRRAGYAAAVFRGGERLWGKVGRRHIHGRTAAGGWSQQRYARRRANQADEIVATLVQSFVDGAPPYAEQVAALATGGDRALLGQARELLARTDRRLAEVLAGVPEVRLAVGTPTAQDLAHVPDRVLAVRIHLTDTLEPGGSIG